MTITFNITPENIQKLDYIIRTLAKDSTYRQLQGEFIAAYDGFKAQLTPWQKAALVEILDLYGDINDHLLIALYRTCIKDGRQLISQQAAV